MADVSRIAVGYLVVAAGIAVIVALALVLVLA